VTKQHRKVLKYVVTLALDGVEQSIL